MTPNTLSEEEFKKVLKSLLYEKKRIKELQKKLDEKGLQKKFQTKLSDIHKFSLAEEYAKLKKAYSDKEKECEEKKEALSKVKPAIKKLFLDLQNAKNEKDQLLEKAKEKIIAFEKEKNEQKVEKETRENENNLVQTKIFHLEEKLAEAKEIKESFEAKVFYLEKALKEKEEALVEKTATQEKEINRFEQDKAKFATKVAECLTQISAQNETIQVLRTTLEKSEAHLVRSEMEELIRKKERCFEETLDESYKKLRELSQAKGHLIEENECFAVELEKKKEIAKELSDLKEDVAHLKVLLEEKEKELSKARAHMAKKLKEMTLLGDLFQNQKTQMMELQERISRQKEDLEQLQNTLMLKNLNEERLLDQAKERSASVDALIKEWQEKYLALQADWQEKKNQLLEFQKMKVQYEQMSRAFSELKTYLGKNLDGPTSL